MSIAPIRISGHFQLLSFTTTTIIPIGYGDVCPALELGRLLLVIYGMIGIPLALVTMAGTGKYISQGVTRWLEDVSKARIKKILGLKIPWTFNVPSGLFLSNLCVYMSLMACYFTAA
ncbi:unnamed protein product [Cylicostephanus goldi]|uniref:Potassium channel domain-containing protein n=1 Tax=Cylicostephanus goldi TaxID=71465 RepID=A0A3P6UTH7_CYLGO|nr:unnamed protein product [Cylicostephanus goldi]